jgi:hypothetical protein
LYELERRGVEKALVIRDCNGASPEDVEGRMTEKIANRNYSFPRGVGLCAVRREMETWLLSDGQAISQVALARGGRRVEQVQGTLEDVVDPKAKLVKVLSKAGLTYTSVVCEEIARETRLAILRYRCPSFRSFESKVRFARELLTCLRCPVCLGAQIALLCAASFRM